MKSQSVGSAPDLVSTGTKRVRVPRGVKVRAALTAGAAHCYAPVASKAIRS